jgi:hypothetical protein
MRPRSMLLQLRFSLCQHQSCFFPEQRKQNRITLLPFIIGEMSVPAFSILIFDVCALSAKRVGQKVCEW